MIHETQYAKSGELNIAYQVVGDGPFDLVYVPGWVSNVEAMWDEPGYARVLERLASFSRLILFDKRGTGLSDPVPEHKLPTLEQRMDDVRAVMDAVGSERAALLGHSEGGNMSALFAATYPARTSALVLVACYAKRIRSDDYPWAPTREEREREIDDVERVWGRPEYAVGLALSKVGDEAFGRWFGKYLRMSASPRAAAALMRMNSEIDVRDVLTAISIPSLLLYREQDSDVSVEEGRYIASRIPGAKLVELPGRDHLMWTENSEALVGEIEEFLTGVRRGPEPDRVLATVLFTDIVSSTVLASRLGDREWASLLERHHAAVRLELERWRGHEVGHRRRRIPCDLRRTRAGDQMCRRRRTGRPPARDRDPGRAPHRRGRARGRGDPGHRRAHRGSGGRDHRPAGGSGLEHRQGPGGGSGIAFSDRGMHALKGVPGEWRLFSASETVARGGEVPVR